MNQIWHKKLTAWLHDPAEKCFVLFHDPSGHEGGTTRTLLRDLNLDRYDNEIKTADHWAAAADRPQWPRKEGEARYAEWSQVDFAQKPVIIHPLTGEQFDLVSLQSIDYKQVKAASLNHFKNLLELGGDNAQLQFLALWRFAPEIDAEGLAKLWQVLPADTRIPDHTIWNHLDLVSALAGAKIENDSPAILTMSFGPVQSFIAQARSTSDLWAGSHLLSSLVWEGMKVLAGAVGPDAFIFPQIRGLAIVDAWLLSLARNNNLGEKWKKQFEKVRVEWLKSKTDANPLFAACLPNKFSAIVPKSRAKELAQAVTGAVRKIALEWAQKIPEYLGFSENTHALSQFNEQFREFPHTYWSIVDWATSTEGESLEKLQSASDLFNAGDNDGFFEQQYWKTLKKEVLIAGKTFYKPNPGVLYPALYELSEKLLGASKSNRSFSQSVQKGFRCTLCGEREWLSETAEQMNIPPGQRKLQGTNWIRNAGKYGIKAGEHLCGVCALKRFWPRLFADSVKEYTDNEIARYVISTHTMALIPSLEIISNASSMQQVEECLGLNSRIADVETTALPKKLYSQTEPLKRELLKKIPAYLDSLKDGENDTTSRSFEGSLKKAFGKDFKLETYYALILMDGDNMGAWLSGSERDRCMPYSASWHPAISEQLNAGNLLNDSLKDYLKALKPASPGKHAFISQALNNFSSMVVPYLVEEKVNGKLIYSGGDDVLALASTSDIIELMQNLRLAYSGIGGNGYKRGFALLKNRLLPTMGSKATASAGVVIAHHQTPLSYVLRCLREAEQRAKAAGRNAFCLRILKRAGGEVCFTDTWWNGNNVPQEIADNGLKGFSSIGLFEELVKTAASSNNFSRKAFYAVEEWAHLLPESYDESKKMASAMLSRQFEQHGGSSELAVKVVEKVWEKAAASSGATLRFPLKQLKDLLFCAEFFARETRAYKHKRREDKE